VIVYLNGQYIEATSARVSIWDGGYLYGDGIYTTLRLYSGIPLDLAAHVARLEKHAGVLALPIPVDEDRLRTIACELARANGLAASDSRLRITVSRGGDPENPLPLQNLEKLPSTVLVTVAPISPEQERWAVDGIPVITLDDNFARGNFPELKTLNSLATLRALRRAAVAGCPEALLTDPNGRLLEGAISNLFIVSGPHLMTPLSEGGFLAGRTRERIMKLARREGIPVREEHLERSDLKAADEVFVASSVREILPVTAVDGAVVGAGVPGPVTRLIQTRYRELVRAALTDRQD
jgi:branched-subunit amino acid aminotransferase/4-amino-4-deoxychorismate lyase